MGCGGSSAAPVEEVKQAEEYQNVKLRDQDTDDLKFDLERAEAKAVEAGPERNTFLASVLEASKDHSNDAKVMKECCIKLRAYNAKLKSFIATADAEAVKEAMDGGFLGLGTNNRKLISVLCSRTKSQLVTTAKRYRTKYDLDLRADVQGEVGGWYGKMMSWALASKEAYVADMIDGACGGWFTCNETLLVELFVSSEQGALKKGKQQWEDRTDKMLIDYLKSNLGSSYRHLFALLCLLLKGDLNNEDETVDDAAVSEQVDKIHAEVTKGMFSFSDDSVDVLIEIVGSNNTAQNVALAEAYENKHNKSLRKAMKDRCAEKIGWCLASLLLPRADFIASRVHKAIEGWSTDKHTLVRLLGGLDNRKLVGVLEAYERKYSIPLANDLDRNIGGNFAIAALTWIRALDDPSGGVEEFTEKDPEDFSGDAPKLSGMLDFMLIEYEALLRFCAALDMETLKEAIKGFGTDDTRLIRTLTTRSKRFLGRTSYLYRETYDETLSTIIDKECSGWYAYLAKFLVLQASQADALLLDIALEGEVGSADKNALIEFLCARHPRRVRAAKKAWEKRNDAYLVDRLSDELSGDLRTVCLKLLKGKRVIEDFDEDKADQKLAKAQARELQGDMSKAIDILTTNSPVQNAAIATSYENTYDSSLSRALGEEFDGSVRAALTALTQEPAQWYAARLKASFKNMTASDRTVCRIIGAHDKDEIKAIAAAYDDRYGRRLKSDISSFCEGQYKRLAVAWIDLPDQLQQPEKLIELPEIPNEREQMALEDDDDDELDDEDPENLPDPSSAMYKAKIMMWQKKLLEAEEKMKARRAAYYRRLLTMYPPLPSGHTILRGYAEALEEEYKKGNDGMVKMWLSATNDSDFESAGTTKDIFDEWQNTSELMVRDKLISVPELKTAWGLNKKPQQPPPAFTEVEQPTPVAAAPPVASAPPMMPKMPSQFNMMRNFGGFGQQQAFNQTTTTTTTTFNQTMVQQPAVVQMGVQRMAATVPWGVYGGMQMTVNTPHGPMRVTVPPGYGPGSSFTFNVPIRQHI